MRRFTFLKGQATLNDFVIIEDHHGMQGLSPDFVRQLCDRRGGIGADGVMRVVRAGQVKAWRGDPGLWYLDLHGADGTPEQDCGNGLRVFARYLMNEQLVSGGRFQVATVDGVRDVRIARGGMISVNLPRGTVAPDPATLRLADGERVGVGVDVGSPRFVFFVPDAELDSLDLGDAAVVAADGTATAPAAIDCAAVVAPDHLRLRSLSRSGAELVSCGVGAVAAVVAHRHAHDGPTSVLVDTAGGRLQVDLRRTGDWLTGPAMINMRGEYWA